MGVDHRLLKTSENFKGLDLRSSDIMRNQEFSTDMRNAAYRISGAINKRKGFTHKRNSNFIKGMTTFKNIGANGSIVDELIYVENNTIQKEVEFDMVGYRSSNVTTSPISLQLTRDAGTSTITAVDAAGGSFFNQNYTSSDTIQTFIDDFSFKSDFIDGTPIIDFASMTTLSVYNLASAITMDWDPGATFDFDEQAGDITVMIPIAKVNTSAVQSILNEPNGTEKTDMLRRLLTIGGKNSGFPPSVLFSDDEARSNLSTTYSSGTHNFLAINMPEFGNLYIGSSYNNDTGGGSDPTAWEYTPSTDYTTWSLGEYFLFLIQSGSFTVDPKGGGKQKSTFNISNLDSTIKSGYNSLDSDLTDVTFPTFPSALDTSTQVTKIASKNTSNISLQLRNDANQSVNQFLSQSIDRLNVFNTEISNNASTTFPTKVTIGSIQEQVGSNLSWTSAQYEDVLTENVNFAPLNNLLYMSNGIDELLKYDGDDVYRAGLPNCDKDIATFSFNTTSTDYLHEVKPGQVEYFTLDDSVFDNPNTVDETLVGDRKYYLEFKNNGGTAQFRRKHGSITGNYGSFSSWSDLSAYGSTSVLNGNGFAVEVTTDGSGYVKNYYQIEAGTGFLGEADNGTFPNFIEITKAMFLYSTSNNNSTLTYGRLDIVEVSSKVREKTYEYRFAYEYTDFKGNIISSQPSDPVKLVVGSGKSVNIAFPATIAALSTFKTNGLFNDEWESSTGTTLGTSLTDSNYPIDKLHDENRMRILVYRSKGYSPIAGEVVGQYYKIADLEYEAGGSATTVTDKYRDEPSDPEAATQYDPIINPFLAFVEPIKRKDPPPKGKYLSVFKNCLVVAGQNDNVNNVQYSLPKNFTTGEIGSEYFPDDDNGIVVESPFGSKITAIAALKDLMFVFHRDSIFTVSGNINQLELPNVELLTKEGGVGCTSQASIEEYRGGLAFVSDTGIYTVSNQGLSELSELIRPLFLNSNFVKEKAISFNWTSKNLLLVCIPDYIIQGDSEYNVLEDTMSAYISSDSLILAYDYFRQAWLRWDTLEFTNGITESSDTVNFSRMTNTTNVLASITDNGDADDYSDNGNAIKFVYETNWESLGDPTVPKKFLRIKVHSFDTDASFESPGFQLEAGVQNDYINANSGKIDFDFSKQAGGGWGNFRWGTDSWGSLPSQFLKSKLPTGKSRSLKIRFANNTNNENILITNYELEIAAPYRAEIKE
tara:strand:+ start:9166 stop:12801 length:3636 start_codon:yes stop_codon:yes gene_type:complete